MHISPKPLAVRSKSMKHKKSGRFLSVHLSCQKRGTPTYNGTIYIEGSVGSNGRMSYTMTIVGTGLHLEQADVQQGGGVISTQIPSTN